MGSPIPPIIPRPPAPKMPEGLTLIEQEEWKERHKGRPETPPNMIRDAIREQYGGLRRARRLGIFR